ncbi:MAG TPA: PAS domain S-box protein, partial [Usitatibacter sp.]|nr:PAS domain S-box protein [Usitatibacter sp.]
MLGALPHVLWVVAPDGRIVLSEGGALPFIGLTAGEAVGRNVYELFQDAPEITQEFRRGLAGEEATWMASVAGRVFETISRPLRGPGGEIEALAGLSCDVTGRKRAEDHLRESEARYRLLFATSPMPMWVYDQETLRFLAVNDAAVERYGYSADEFLAMSILEIRPPEEIPRLLEDVRRERPVLEEAAGYWRHRRKDGEEIEVKASSHAMEFGGRPARLVAVQDMTSRLRSDRLQAALYRIGEITQSAEDLDTFYAELHRIVG